MYVCRQCLFSSLLSFVFFSVPSPWLFFGVPIYNQFGRTAEALRLEQQLRAVRLWSPKDLLEPRQAKRKETGALLLNLRSTGTPTLWLPAAPTAADPRHRPGVPSRGMRGVEVFK